MTVLIRLRHHQGFTLMEMLIAIAIVGILAAIGLPSYQNSINKSREKSAAADLMALSTDMENTYQRTLAYPTQTTATTALTAAASIGWSASQDDFFVYSVASTSSAYTLTATGSGAMSGCVMTLTQANVRTASSGCIMDSW